MSKINGSELNVLVSSYSRLDLGCSEQPRMQPL